MPKKGSPYKTILERCLAVRPGEIVVIITDNKKRPIANKLLDEAQKIVREAGIVEITERKTDWEEPPDFVSSSLKKCNAAFIITSKSLLHTKTSKEAAEMGVRIASLPCVTEDMINRAIDIDYAVLNKLNQKLIELLLKTSIVTIQSPRGTNFKFRIDPERPMINNNGLYYKEGDAGTLPPGSVVFAPVEGSAEGTIVVDGSLMGQTVDSPVKLVIQSGRIVDIKGGKAAKRLQETLTPLGPESLTVGEFGIGTNPKARLSGIPVEDEKTFANCYIALGNNIGIGGRVFARTHISCILKKPTISLEKKKIVQGGKFLLGKL